MPRLQDIPENRMKVSVFDTMKSIWDDYINNEEYLENLGGFPSRQQYLSLIGYLMDIIERSEEYYQPSLFDKFTTFNTFDNEYKVEAYDKMKKLYDEYMKLEKKVNNPELKGEDSAEANDSNTNEESDDNKKDPDYVDDLETEDEEDNDEDNDEDNLYEFQTRFMIDFVEPLQRVPFQSHHCQFYTYGLLTGGFIVSTLAFLFMK